MRHAHLFAACLLAVVAGWSGCRRSSPPDALFAEAECLRRAFAEEASRQAITKYRAALTAWKRQGEMRRAARAAQGLAGSHEQLGQLTESRQAYLEALSLTTESHDVALESEILSEVGVADALTGDFVQAERHCERALALARRLGADRETALALNCLGEVDYHRSDPRRALVSYREAEKLLGRVSDKRLQAQTCFLLGSALADVIELDSARRYFEDALNLWTQLEDGRGQAFAALALARLPYLRGEFQEALNRYTSLTERFRASGDLIPEATCLSTLGYVYEQLGDTPSARTHWERASEVFKTAGPQMAVLEMYTKIGSSYLAEDTTAALRWFERARTLSEASGDKNMLSWALRHIGVAHLARGDPRTALLWLEQALRIQEPLLVHWYLTRMLTDAGTAHILLGDWARATDSFTRALSLSQASADGAGQAMAFFGLARIGSATNDLDTARTHVLAALRIAESLRTRVENSDLRSSFFASVYHYHELYLDVLMRLDRLRPGRGLEAAAFEANERARARSLLESLADARVDFRGGVDPKLLARENEVRLAFDTWADRQRRLAEKQLSEADLRALRQEHRDLEERFAQIQAEIRTKSPRYANLAQPKPLGLARTQRQVLDAGTLLLEYALGEERSYLWAVSDKKHSSHVLPPRARIEDAARRVYSILSDGSRPRDDHLQPEMRRLSEMLLGPVAREMAGKRLLIVADGALQYIPFGALPVPGVAGDPVPMAVRHEIVSLPSASVLAVLRRETTGRETPPGAVAVLADPVFEADDPRERAAVRQAGSARPPAPDAGTPAGSRPNGPRPNAGQGVSAGLTHVPPRLASTRQEADAIMGIVLPGPALKRTGFDASRAAAMDPGLGRYRIVHFATHGVFDNENPALSGIFLSLFDQRGQEQPGFLSLHDIYTLRLPVELVVLSACNTALGKPVRGEGLVGIVRGFMYAGAKRVVASLWKVDDEATGELMRQFYAAMFRQNRSPAAALRQAQLAMTQQERWKAPFYWAAFVIQGEWR